MPYVLSDLSNNKVKQVVRDAYVMHLRSFVLKPLTIGAVIKIGV